MVYLYTYITCWTRAVKDIYLYILCIDQSRSLLFCSDSEICLCDTRQSSKTRLESLFVTLEFNLKVGCKRHIPQGRYEDSLWHNRRICRDSIRQLVDVSEETCFEQKVYHLRTFSCLDIKSIKTLIVLFVFGRDLNA